MCNTPRTPHYAKPAPLPNKNCIGCSGGNGLVYPPLVSGGGGGKAIELLEGYAIDITDQSDSDTDRFKIAYSPQTALSVALTLILKSVGVIKSQPVLIGTEIDEIISSWSYNKPIATQSLTFTTHSPDPAIASPSLNAGDRNEDTDSISVTTSASVKIHGDDGNGSISEDTKTIVFGNYVAYGDELDQIGADAVDLQDIFTAFTKAIQLSRARALTTTGGANRYFFYFVPKRFGEVIFTKGIFIGGYRRLKSVLGVLKVDLEVGDVEQDILLDNGTGYEEAYYVYQSEYDNKADSVTPTYAS